MLLDSRHGPTPHDLDVMEFLKSQDIPITVVFTKTDLLKNQSERFKRTRDATSVLKGIGIDPSSVFWVSSTTKLGLSELVRSFIESKNDRKNRGDEGQCQEE